MATSKLTTLMNLFVSADRILQEQLRADDKSPPFSFLDYAVIELVHESPFPPTMRELARFMGVTPPAATAIVDRLVRQKVMRRVPDKNDRRCVRLHVTAKGLKQHEKNLKIFKKKMSIPFRVLSDSDINALVKILQKLVDSHKKK